MEEFEFLVIGTGSGLNVANTAADKGHSVAIVEKGPIGGTCLNRGCIPSKHLLYHADVHEMIHRSGKFHIDASINSVDFEEIVRDVNAKVTTDAESIRRGLQSSDQHELFEGEARFDGDRVVEITEGKDAGTQLTAKTVLIAAGTRPTIPSIEGIDAIEYLTSTEALKLDYVPGHLVIVGGGYIAAELGHFFGTFGSDISIIGRRPHLLPEADQSVADSFTERFADRFDIHTGYTATGAWEDSGTVTVEAHPYEYGEHEGLVEDADSMRVTGDELLVAAGRRPNSDRLNLDTTGVETDEEGFIETDEYLRTTADNIWALGDIVGEYLLKHNANYEAQIVARNLYGDNLTEVDYHAMPFAVFASPEVAGVGEREEELRADNRDYAVNTYKYEDTARGDAMKTEGFVKVLIDLSGEILGCHIIGPEAATLIQEVVVAMKAGDGTVHDIRDSIHIHPALPEVVQRAFSGQFQRDGENITINTREDA